MGENRQKRRRRISGCQWRHRRAKFEKSRTCHLRGLHENHLTSALIGGVVLAGGGVERPARTFVAMGLVKGDAPAGHGHNEKLEEGKGSVRVHV